MEIENAINISSWRNEKDSSVQKGQQKSFNEGQRQFKFVMCEAKSENCTGLLGKGY